MEKMGEQGELDELRARLAALEAEVVRLREESAAARTAAAHTAEARAAEARTTEVPAAAARTVTKRGAATRETGAAVTATATSRTTGKARATAVTARAGRDGTEAGSSADTHTPVPDAVRPDQVEIHQSMTGLADALGVMRSEQADRIDRIGRANRANRALQAEQAEQAERAEQALQAERAEQQTQVLRTRPPEARSSAPARHSQFLESLLAGQAVLQEEPHREGR
ncbi:hypothetical protein [Kitasatospora sp. NPDC097691]|uniref:hypothetical protein n=1 Tax=Kitasatospora sp. NPDC097691 TaxID=3157231 RepID=UPI00331DA076